MLLKCGPQRRWRRSTVSLARLQPGPRSFCPRNLQPHNAMPAIALAQILIPMLPTITTEIEHLISFISSVRTAAKQTGEWTDAIETSFRGALLVPRKRSRLFAMTIKDAIILLLVVFVGCTVANLIALYIAAQQVQGKLQGNSTANLLGGLSGLFSSSPAPAS